MRVVVNAHPTSCPALQAFGVEPLPSTPTQSRSRMEFRARALELMTKPIHIHIDRRLIWAHIQNMYIHSRSQVIEQIPAGMIRIEVYNEIIAAVPTPVITPRPVPGCDLKIESARQPKEAVDPINANNFVLPCRAKVTEPAMVKRMLQAITRIIRQVMAIPMAISKMRRPVDGTIRVVLNLRRSIGRAPWPGRRRSSRPRGRTRLCAWMLSKCRRKDRQHCAEYEDTTGLHCPSWPRPYGIHRTVCVKWTHTGCEQNQR